MADPKTGATQGLQATGPGTKISSALASMMSTTPFPSFFNKALPRCRGQHRGSATLTASADYLVPTTRASSVMATPGSTNSGTHRCFAQSYVPVHSRAAMLTGKDK
jgi:hypothetical protein